MADSRARRHGLPPVLRLGAAAGLSARARDRRLLERIERIHERAGLSGLDRRRGARTTALAVEDKPAKTGKGCKGSSKKSSGEGSKNAGGKRGRKPPGAPPDGPVLDPDERPF